MSNTTQNIKQLGFCEDCHQPAYATRHSTGIWLNKGDDGNWRSGEYQIEHRMCVWHKGKYIRHMDEMRKKLEKQRGIRHGDQSRSQN